MSGCDFDVAFLSGFKPEGADAIINLSNHLSRRDKYAVTERKFAADVPP